MKRIPFLAIVLLAFAFPAHAQDAMKKDAAVKPADPELKVVLDSWNEVGRKLIAMAEDFPEDKYKSKADIVAFVKKSCADGAAAIQSKGEKGLTTEVVYFAHQKARVLDMAYGLIEHSGEHYGQLVVYYRLAGLVPPESRPKK